MAAEIDIEDLQKRLQPLSHGTEAVDIIKAALKQLPNLTARVNFLNEVMLCSPITHEELQPQYPGIVEPFHVMQGDILRMDSAYILGSRMTGNPSYVLCTSTCDAAPGRRTAAQLLSIEPRKRSHYASDAKLQSDLGSLLGFNANRYFYLPALPDDEKDVVFNIAHLNPEAQCYNTHLALAERRASMTLIGWRLLGALLRSFRVREAQQESEIRTLWQSISSIPATPAAKAQGARVRKGRNTAA